MVQAVHVVFAQEPVIMPEGQFETTVPFKLIGGHIFVDIKINDKSATFLLDSGSGANVITPAAAKVLGVEPKGRSGTAKGVGEQLLKVGHGTALEMRIGLATLPNPSFFIIPLPNEIQCQGLLGFDTFNQFVTRIDYERQLLTFTRPGQFRPSKSARSYPLSIRSNTPQMDGELDGIKGIFKLDTGANDSLTVFAAFTERHKLRTKYPRSLEAIDGKGIGGYVRSQVVRLGSLKIGEFVLPDVIAGLSRNMQGVFAEGGPAANIGSGILSRFTVTFDYRHRKIYLEPNGMFNRQELFNRSGLVIDKIEGKWKVIDVIAGGPGDEVGIKVNDEVVSMDGKPSTAVTLQYIAEKSRQAVGTTVKITVLSAGGKKDLTFVLRDLI